MPINKKILFLLPLLALACSITPAASLAAMVTPSPSPSPTPFTPSPTASPQVCTVTAESLHLRAMPGTDAEVIGYLYAGEVLTILPDPPAESWIRVRAGNLTGWINFHYCKKGQ